MRANMKSAIRLATVFVLGSSAFGCDQPKPTCTIARGTFAARYTLVPGTLVPNGADDSCGQLHGEEIYVQAYNQPKSETDTNPNPKKIRVGIQPSGLANLLWGAGGLPEPVSADPADQGYALGDFADIDPGKDDFCSVPTLTAARVRLPAIPEMVVEDICGDTVYPASEAVDAQYEWSNLRVYLTAGANGTQFTGDLKYTSNGCSAQYRVVALYPSVYCGAIPTTDMNPATGDDAGEPDGGEPVDGGLGGMDGGDRVDAGANLGDGGEPAEDVDGSTGPEVDCGAAEEPEEPSPDPVADDSMCGQNAPESDSMLTGSALNPEFVVQCDPQLLRCMLRNEPPSLR